MTVQTIDPPYCKCMSIADLCNISIFVQRLKNAISTYLVLVSVYSSTGNGIMLNARQIMSQNNSGLKSNSQCQDKLFWCSIPQTIILLS